MLRTLGASRALLQGAALAEFALLGLLAGIMAALFANAISYALALRLFDLPGQLNPQIWLFGCVGGMLVVGLIGLAATRGLVRTPPVLVLQRLAN